MKAIEKILKLFSDLSALVGLAALAALIVLTVVTVFFRAIGIAFPGTYALAELLLVPAICFALVYAAWSKAHTRVELFTVRLPERVASLLEAATTALGALFWIFVSWASVREALIRQAQNERAPLLDIPVSPFRWTMVSALVLLCVILVFLAVKALIAAFVPAEDHERQDA